MNRWLLDTNVLSELRRPRPAARVVQFVSSARAANLFVSVVTLAELRFGVERHPDPSSRAFLAAWLEQTVRPMFEDRVLPMDEDTLLTWRLLLDRVRKAGHTSSQPDLMIAATAIRHGLTVVTRDIVDFERTGAPVLDPWRDG